MNVRFLEARVCSLVAGNKEREASDAIAVYSYRYNCKLTRLDVDRDRRSIDLSHNHTLSRDARVNESRLLSNYRVTRCVIVC